MAIVRGPGTLRDDELDQIQDPELPGPLGLDMNNPQVQQALASMNISGFDQAQETPDQTVPPSPSDPSSYSTMDKLKLAIASSKSIPPPIFNHEVKPQSAKTMDFSDNNNYADQMKEAIAQKNRNLGLSQMERGAAQVSAGLAGGGHAVFNPDLSQSEFTAKLADQPIKDLQAKEAADKSDPNNGYSKGLRDWAKQTYNIDLKGASAEQVEKIAPYLSKQYEAEQERQNKRMLLEDRNKERQYEAAQRNADRNVKMLEIAQNTKEKQDKKDENDLQNDRYKLDKLLSAETASSRSALGKAANIGRAAEAMNMLATQYKDQNSLDKRQIYELATSLDAMLKGGTSTISGTEHLIPKTYQGDASKIEEYITGLPQGAQQAEFVKRAVETVNREKDLANEQVKRWSKSHAPTFKRLKEKDPESMKAMFKERGIDLDDTDSYSDVQERGIQRVMDSNKVSREQAIKALKDAGKL